MVAGLVRGARCAGWFVDGAGLGRTADRPGEMLASKTADKGRAVRAYKGAGMGRRSESRRAPGR